jgi:hypothetical protein
MPSCKCKDSFFGIDCSYDTSGVSNIIEQLQIFFTSYPQTDFSPQIMQNMINVCSQNLTLSQDFLSEFTTFLENYIPNLALPQEDSSEVIKPYLYLLNCVFSKHSSEYNFYLIL